MVESSNEAHTLIECVAKQLWSLSGSGKRAVKTDSLAVAFLARFPGD